MYCLIDIQNISIRNVLRYISDDITYEKYMLFQKRDLLVLSCSTKILNHLKQISVRQDEWVNHWKIMIFLLIWLSCKYHTENLFASCDWCKSIKCLGLE